jgi:hypothetical protein
MTQRIDFIGTDEFRKTALPLIDCLRGDVGVYDYFTHDLAPQGLILPQTTGEGGAARTRWRTAPETTPAGKALIALIRDPLTKGGE